LNALFLADFEDRFRHSNSADFLRPYSELLSEHLKFVTLLLTYRVSNDAVRLREYFRSTSDFSLALLTSQLLDYLIVVLAVLIERAIRTSIRLVPKLI